MTEIVIEYRVGTAKVTIVRDAEGSFQYIVKEQEIEDAREEIRRNIEVIIMGSEDSNDNMYSLVKTAIRFFKTRRKGKLPEANIAYAFRKELKYKKLQVLIDDPYVEDISIVGPGNVWVRHSYIVSRDPHADYIRTNIVLKDMFEFLEYMNLLAEKAGKLISRATPIVDANLPESDGGHRIHLVHPDIADGKGEIVIRKKKSSTLVRVKELVSNGMLTRDIVLLLQNVITKRGSILIVGPPGSGKTTLLRAILYDLIPHDWKVAIIEDTPEIDPPQGSCWVRYVTPMYRVTNGGSIEFDQMALTKAALRSSVNRFIVIGETRGAEARVLVQAMNMGMGGLTTFHGGSAEEAIMRLTSPPINLTAQQVAMFNLIVTLNYVVDCGLKRAVIAIDEPVYDKSENSVMLNRIYEYGEDVAYDVLVSRLRRVSKINHGKSSINLYTRINKATEVG